MKIQSPDQVQYLAFEGGGGKGIAYLGALRALEHLGMLPVSSSKTQASVEVKGLCNQNTSKIKGISGASAGAITAYLLSLGHNSAYIAKLMSKAEIFNSFYDGPDNDLIRRVNFNKYSRDNILNNPLDENRSFKQKERSKRFKKLKEFPFGSDPFSLTTSAIGTGSVAALGAASTVLTTPSVATLKDLISLKELVKLANLFTLINSLGAPLKLIVSNYIREYLMDALKEAAVQRTPLTSLIKVLTENETVFLHYLYNLVYDRGLFPGFELRDFLKGQMMEYLKGFGETGSAEQLVESAGKINFEEFYCRSGIDLVVTGVNITTNNWKYFGVRTTPYFPVVDAVALSASFPGAFKPVLVTNCDPYVESGFWLDGGFLNNLPIHAFDLRPDGPLNQNVVALRLSSISTQTQKDDDGYKQRLRKIMEREECSPRRQADSKKSMNEGLLDVLIAHITDLGDTILYPSEEGQLRTADEEDQTIPLYTFCLDTLEFAPPLTRSRTPIKWAYASTAQYFSNLTGWQKRAEELIGELEELHRNRTKK